MINAGEIVCQLRYFLKTLLDSSLQLFKLAVIAFYKRNDGRIANYFSCRLNEVSVTRGKICKHVFLDPNSIHYKTGYPCYAPRLSLSRNKIT